MDIIKILRNARTQRILMKHSLMNPEIQHKITHSTKNLIDLKSDESSSVIEESENDEENGPQE